MTDESPYLGMDNLQIEPTDMLVDPEEYNDLDEKQDVAIISPEAMDEDLTDEAEQDPLADDFEAMKARLLPELPDLETESEAVSTWDVENWRSLPRRSTGPVFLCGGQPWRILLFPYGNNVEFASMYLEHGFDDKPPEDWYKCVQFALVMWNPNDPTMQIIHYAHHRFTPEEGDWGFTRFQETRRLFQVPWDVGHTRPMIENEACKVTAYVRVVKDPTGVLWHNFVNYDSKKETGYVGLRNQGATCYLNSLLQSLYFTNAFRKAVYQIPTENEETLSNSAYTLQRLFYQLQTNSDAVPTLELTKSFGWETKHIFEQQDVQELSRKLMERLEEKMKGTDAENALPKLFVGKTKTYVSCINVDYESSRIEDYWDIQLNVSGNKNLSDSFKDYIQVETMDGENKYFAEGHGLQDAKKGVIFESFPDILHLQLKRFEYDVNRDAMMKVNDRYEFPEIFDAAPFLSAEADKSEAYTYQLHGVLVHSGDFNAGHYYAFLKPTKDGFFYRFDDDRVTRATMKEVLEENFGGEYANLPNGSAGVRNAYTRTLSTKRSMSAYMLVYIRQSRLDKVLVDVTDDIVPKHLERKLEEEKILREQKRKEREEQHLYLNVHVVTDQTFLQFQGLDLAVWDTDPAEDPSAPRHYRLLKTTTIKDFTRIIGQDTNQDPEGLRIWVMVNRQNKTIRPDQPLTALDMTIEHAFARYGTRPAGFRVWAESAEKIEDGKAIWPDTIPQPNNNNYILLLLKHFDAENQTLKGAGHIYVKKHEKVHDLAGPILQLMGWSPGVTLKLYEEIKPSMIDSMKPKQTLHQAEIQDGDIICFEKQLSEKELLVMQKAGKYTDAREFYDYLVNRLVVYFESISPQVAEGDAFSLTLSRKMTYDQLAAKVGDHLKVDPTHLRFSTVNATTGNAKQQLKRQHTNNLQQILMPQYGYGNSNTKPDALYYEILDVSLSELESKKILKVTYLSEGITKEQPVEILIAKNGIIDDVIPLLQKKLGLDDEIALHLRFYQAHNGKVYKELTNTYTVAGVNEFVQLYAEKTPEDELTSTEGEMPIFSFHFNKEPNKIHGVPFKFIMRPDEPFKETKIRLEKRTGFKGKMLEKIKFALIRRATFSKPQYLNDDDILFELASCGDDLLGLDHVDRTKSFWSKGDAIFIR